MHSSTTGSRQADLFIKRQAQILLCSSFMLPSRYLMGICGGLDPKLGPLNYTMTAHTTRWTWLMIFVVNGEKHVIPQVDGKRCRGRTLQLPFCFPPR